MGRLSPEDADHVPRICEVCARPLSAREKALGEPWTCNRCRESTNDFPDYLTDWLRGIR